MYIKSSTYKGIIDRILEQSHQPVYIEELIERIAYQLDEAPIALRDKIKAFLYRTPEYIILPKYNDRYVLPLERFTPYESNEELIRKVLDFIQHPISPASLDYVLGEFETFRGGVSRYYIGYDFFDEGNKFLAYYIKPVLKEQAKKKFHLPMLRDVAFIGLQEWGFFDGFIKIPNNMKDYTSANGITRIDEPTLTCFGCEILGVYWNTINIIKFKKTRYTTELNTILEEIFDTNSFDKYNKSFYDSYKDCLKHIETHCAYPKESDNPTLWKWLNRKSFKGVYPLLRRMCEYNLQRAQTEYRDAKKKELKKKRKK